MRLVTQPTQVRQVYALIQGVTRYPGHCQTAKVQRLAALNCTGNIGKTHCFILQVRYHPTLQIQADDK